MMKLILMIQNEICTPEEIVIAFILSKEDIHFKYEKDLKHTKQSLNQWKWEILNDLSGNPKAIAQLLLDFMEGLHSPIIDSKDYAKMMELGD